MMGGFVMANVFLLLFTTTSAFAYSCPSKCICKKTNFEDDLSLKLRCGNSEQKILKMDEIPLKEVGDHVLQLNLSNNLLAKFTPDSDLLVAQKLDLSRNKLIELSADQFQRTPNLLALDVSFNDISNLDVNAFTGLTRVKKVKLNGNRIVTILRDTFEPLSNLKQVDISNNPLRCDCAIQWLLEFVQRRSVKLLSGPKCDQPSTLHGVPLRKAKLAPAECNATLEHLSMSPDTNQLIFEGDSFSVECSASNANYSIEWSWQGANDTDDMDVVIVNTEQSSVLTVKVVKPKHSGVWRCQLANNTKEISVYVVGSVTKFCPDHVTQDNKGTYAWPAAMQNQTVKMRCDLVNPDVVFSSDQFATNECNADGHWANLNTSQCEYVSKNTRIMQHFASINSSLVVESAKHFRNFTRKALFNDVVDVKYAMDTVEAYLKQSTVEQLDGVLMDVVDNLMELPKRYLAEAEEKYGVCSKLVEVSERLARVGSNSALTTSRVNIDTAVFSFGSALYSGVKCTWLWNMDTEQRQSHCHPLTDSDYANPEDGDFGDDPLEILASVILPKTLLLQFGNTRERFDILVAFHHNNKLFPVVSKDIDRAMDMRGFVIGVKLLNTTTTELIDPIVITMKRSTPTANHGNVTPVWWNDTWTSSRCTKSHFYPHADFIAFECYNFGYYGLFENVTQVMTLKNVTFKLSHPAIYVGSFVLLMSFSLIISIYLCHFENIQMPKNTKHSLVNLWSSVWLLCVTFNLGIYTEWYELCQIVGIALHFFTLASLLWYTVCLNCLYKKLAKCSATVDDSDDDMMSGLAPVVKKSLSGLYFLGWGVPAIVAGLTVAININDYVTAPEYCFLRSGPPLGALYVPAIIICACSFVYFVLVRCALYAADVKSEGTQVTEHVDIDFLGAEGESSYESCQNCRNVGVGDQTLKKDLQNVRVNQSNANNRDGLNQRFQYAGGCHNFVRNRNCRNCQSVGVRAVSRASTNTSTTSSEIDDPEHSARAQLCSLAIFIILYLSVWLLCALATLWRSSGWQETLFANLYASCCVILGGFIIFFYCVSRSDVRTQMKNKKARRKSVIESTQAKVVLERAAASNSVVTIATRSSSRSSPVVPSAGERFVNVISPTTRIIENPTVLNFYNPHQSTVAKRFFKRQRLQQMQRMRSKNMAKQRDSDDDDSGALSSIFGTSSKVNNANIHVNNDVGTNKERKYGNGYVKVASKKVHNVEKVGTRSISQQCSLEYSSESVPGIDMRVDTPMAGELTAFPMQHFPNKLATRKNSCSITDLDELYAEIRSGPSRRLSWQQLKGRNVRNPYHSDSDVQYKPKTMNDVRDVMVVNDLDGEDHETTV